MGFGKPLLSEGKVEPDEIGHKICVRSFRQTYFDAAPLFDKSVRRRVLMNNFADFHFVAEYRVALAEFQSFFAQSPHSFVRGKSAHVGNEHVRPLVSELPGEGAHDKNGERDNDRDQNDHDHRAYATGAVRPRFYFRT